MKKKAFLLYILAFSMMFSFSGCRSKIAETESESETICETEKQTEKETQKQSETQKATEKKTAASDNKKDTSSTDKTTVKPSKINETNKTKTSEKKTQTNASSSAGTQMCPYCYQQISLASDGQGSTIYANHVAQEKAWAEYMASSSAQTTPSTEAPSSGSDSAQCPYCSQWYTISDGSYNAHINAETSGSSDYITCPLCGNTYQKGVEYNTHYCTGINHE